MGDKKSLIAKWPLAARATPARFVSCSVAVAAGPQNREAWTFWPALVPIPLPASFTEGFENADLKRAKALLETMAQA
jgi:hypothetical protein